MTNFRPKSFLHGCDYNPEQWLDRPEILKDDLHLMPLAGTNVMTIGVFSWAKLEPEEGRYEFDWLDKVFDGLESAGQKVVLSTPTAVRPAWMTRKYPEVQRVDEERRRFGVGGRHNHCYSSPVLREKSRALTEALAARYGQRESLVLWHVSNELDGACYCDLCVAEFRRWLQRRYGSLDALNAAWWTTFWSATYSDWDQIEAPGPTEQYAVTGLFLDWQRFATDRTIDFLRWEMEPLRRMTPEVPVTTNFHPGGSRGLDYWKLSCELDVVSWDNYPRWHLDPEGDFPVALEASLDFDLMRSLRHAPFLLMESTPSSLNWMSHSPQKAPGLHLLSSLQAVAHGADSVQYFQWRKCRGSYEQYHGAVLGHCGRSDTRTFRETQSVSQALKALEPALGARVAAEVGILYDWENLWALGAASGLGNDQLRRNFEGCKNLVRPFYEACVRNRVSVEFLRGDEDLSTYRIVLAPSLYLVTESLASRLSGYVESGGLLVGSYLSGQVNESMLCYEGGFPGPLRSLFGLRSEELHHAPDFATAEVEWKGGQRSTASRFMELLRLESAESEATYQNGHYEGETAVARHRVGKGETRYLGASLDVDSQDAWIDSLLSERGVKRLADRALPPDVYLARRDAGSESFLFVMNFGTIAQRVEGLPSGESQLTGARVDGVVELGAYGVEVIRFVSETV